MKISAVIIAKNEEKNISKSIKSVKWCDEILVIDNGSTDGTASISKKLGARVVKFNKGAYREAREKAIGEAQGKWIFYIDADEVCSPALRDEIAQLTSKSIRQSAYAVPRRNIIWGHEFKHSGQWPDYAKRLFLREKLEGWKGEIHEEPNFSGEMAHLKNPIIHNQDRSLSDMVEKTNKWSEVEARLMYGSGHPPMNIWRFGTAVVREFWKRFIRQLAFLDGSKGIIYGLYQVFSKFVSYAKLWEMQIK